MNINDRVEIIAGDYKGITGTIARINEDTYLIKSDKLKNRIMGYPSVKLHEMKNIVTESKNKDVLDVLKIVQKTKSNQKVKLQSGDVITIDTYTANAIMKVYNAVNSSHKKRMAEMLADNKYSFATISDFAFKQVK